MGEILDWQNWFKPQTIRHALRIITLLIIGVPALRLVSNGVGRLVKKRISEQSGMLARKGILYIGLMILLFMVFHELGFNLTALLGTAGIVGIAVGFASQTSVSNIISGLFLIGEKPFATGDLIKVGGRLGIVMSVDLLSIKIRTLDNLFVRIPNENLLKQELVNITRFPVRRMDIDIGVAYKEDPVRVMKVLKEIAGRNPYCLDEPEPLILFKNYGESALEILFALWFEKTDYINLRNSVLPEIWHRFKVENIEIPFPHRTLYAGQASEPFPVRVVDPATEMRKEE